MVFSFGVSIIRHATRPSRQYAPLASARLHSPENASREIGRKMAPTKRQARRYCGGSSRSEQVSRVGCVVLRGSTPACSTFSFLQMRVQIYTQGTCHSRAVRYCRESPGVEMGRARRRGGDGGGGGGINELEGWWGSRGVMEGEGGGERGLIKMMQIQWGGLWWTVSGVNCRMCLIKMISETSERCV